MKVLWVCNTLPGRIARRLGREANVKEGWLDGALSRLGRTSCPDPDIELSVAAYMGGTSDTGERTWGKEVSLSDHFLVKLYEYDEDRRNPEQYDPGLEKVFAAMIDEIRPDIIHIFGTEYGHNLAAAKASSRYRASGERIRILIGIQGIISECARFYCEGMPYEEIDRASFRDRLRNDNVRKQKEKFAVRGRFETQAVSYATDITGRTEFDRTWSESHAPEAEYHHMNETLREDFYNGSWDITECDRYVIFMSQGDYPLKGLHNVLRVMPKIIEEYPDAKLYVAGMDITRSDSIKYRLKLSSYAKYLIRLIKDNGLCGKVVFTGPLSAKQMKERLLKCHTYLCASSIENSPNSMGEAMLLGVPVIAGRVGGIPSLIEDRTEGLMYDDIEQLPDLIKCIWSDDGLATEMGACAMNRATKTHDPDANFDRLMEIYEQLS